MGIFNRKEQPETPDVLNSLNERLSENQQRQKLGGGNQELQQENTGDQLVSGVIAASKAGTSTTPSGYTGVTSNLAC